jgi:hypothetical protein
MTQRDSSIDPVSPPLLVDDVYTPTPPNALEEAMEWLAILHSSGHPAMESDEPPTLILLATRYHPNPVTWRGGSTATTTPNPCSTCRFVNPEWLRAPEARRDRHLRCAPLPVGDVTTCPDNPTHL